MHWVCVEGHRREPVPPRLKMRELELIRPLSKSLATGVATHKKPWPRVWLLGVLDTKMAQRGGSVPP